MARVVGAEVMLDERKWDHLRILAEREGRTPADFLRTLIEGYLEEQERLEEGRFLQVLEELRQIRERNAARWGGTKATRLVKFARNAYARWRMYAASGYRCKHCGSTSGQTPLVGRRRANVSGMAATEDLVIRARPLAC